MTHDEALRESRKKLDEILLNWDRRGIGHTQAMISGKSYGCFFLVNDLRQKNDYVRRGVEHKKIITESSLPESIKGINFPVLVDHFVLSRLIRQAILDAEKRERERILKVIQSCQIPELVDGSNLEHIRYFEDAKIFLSGAIRKGE